MTQGTEDVQDPRESAQQEDQPSDTPAASETSQSPAGESVEAQLRAALAEAADYKDKYLREYADKENFRKRQERITAERVQYARRAVIEELLVDVIDNFDHAARHTETMDTAALRETLRMLQYQLNRVLAAQGVAPVPVVPGQQFDPREHEAIESVESDLPEGAVVDEVRKGYTMGGDLLRPARVTVSKGSRQ
jgi:molecular chaperone GrpE